MISRKKQRIRWLVSGVVLLFVASITVGYSLRDGIEYYKSPTQVISQMPPSDVKFRLGGLVEAGSIDGSHGKDISFVITDNVNSIEVKFSGILPDLFAEKQGIIALGFYHEGLFIAEELLAKHDESYMPKEVMDMLKAEDVYVDPEK
tara:strand:- start:946 stop:1386 length:441 start_codon:yes stop_codon:yes gene_type:complete